MSKFKFDEWLCINTTHSKCHCLYFWCTQKPLHEIWLAISQSSCYSTNIPYIRSCQALCKHSLHDTDASNDTAQYIFEAFKVQVICLDSMCVFVELK